MQSEVTVQRVKCERPGCAFTLPIGYTSPRGYCATCEYTLYRKMLEESLERSEVIASIARTVKRFA
jgi:hypothetical protein